MDSFGAENIRTVIRRNSKERMGPIISSENDGLSTKPQDVRKRLHSDSFQLSTSSKTSDFHGLENGDISMAFQDDVLNGHLYDPSELSIQARTCSIDGPHMLPLIPILNDNVQDYSSSVSVVLNGTACRGLTGPPVGAVDIGVSKCAYYFRIALPGVKKDPGDFSCEIEHNGMVHIRGVTTTGGETVSRHSRVYKMKFRQQCPPGPFTLSFCLPGPVDTRMFSPNFRTDGVFEAVVLKYEL